MKHISFLKVVIPATAAIALAGCVVDSGGGGGGGGITPPPAESQFRQVTESRWIGTAPFCSASPSDCNSLGVDWKHVNSSTTGNGKRCASGLKVQCQRTVLVPR